MRRKFVYAPIFELSYKERNPDQEVGVVTLRHGSQDKDYDVPDGMTVLPHYEQLGTEAMIFRGVHSVDEQKFSTSVGVSLDTEGVSASTSFSIASSSSEHRADLLMERAAVPELVIAVMQR